MSFLKYMHTPYLALLNTAIITRHSTLCNTFLNIFNHFGRIYLFLSLSKRLDMSFHSSRQFPIASQMTAAIPLTGAKIAASPSIKNAEKSRIREENHEELPFHGSATILNVFSFTCSFFPSRSLPCNTASFPRTWVLSSLLRFFTFPALFLFVPFPNPNKKFAVLSQSSTANFSKKRINATYQSDCATVP